MSMDDAGLALPVPLQSVLGGKYRVDGVLGRGGFGAVYRATQLDLGRQVAVKVLHQPSSVEDPGTLARFEREARATGALGHPHIVQVTDFQIGSPSFLVMELLLGESLASVLDKHGRLPPQRAVRIAIQVLSALAATHGIGIVHRDIKPANLLLINTATNDDFVKVLDFGIAKDMSVTGSQQGVTQSGVVIGTVGYMAPEQAFGLAIDSRVDIYAVGGVLYRMLAGVAPLRATSVPEMLHLLAHGSIVPLEQRDATLPPMLCAAIARALSHDPERRFPDAQSFAQQLAASTGLPSPSWAGPLPLPLPAPPSPSIEHRSTSVDRNASGGSTRTDRPPTPSSPKKEMSTGIKVAIALGVLSFVAVVGIGAVLGFLHYSKLEASGSKSDNKEPPKDAAAPSSSLASFVAPPPSTVTSDPNVTKPRPSPSPKPTPSVTPPSTAVVADRAGKCLCQEPSRGRSLCSVRHGKSSCNCVGGGETICVTVQQVGTSLVCSSLSQSDATQGAPCTGNPVRGGKPVPTTVSGIWSCHVCDNDTLKFSGPAGAPCTGFDDTLGTIAKGTLSCTP